MRNRTAAASIAALVTLLAVGAWWLLRTETVAPPARLDPRAEAGDGADVASGAFGTERAALAGEAGEAVRQQVSIGRAETGVRGVVLDAANGQPLGGIEVIAIRDAPSVEPLVARFRGLFQQGMYVETRTERRELGRTVSNPDGTFELTGLPEGRVFLDGRSDGWFVRTPGTARLATGEIREGVELRASPGGRVRGIVLGPDGGPAPGAVVSLRPGVNSFFGQITERQYRWLETTADENGRFDLPGVPEGQGYTATAVAPQMALEDAYGIDVRACQSSEVTLRGHAGGSVAGVVLDVEG
jgi:hypothetical protein